MNEVSTREIHLSVNDSMHVVTVDPETPLLYVLRNELALNAAKYGCGLGRCGTCTVHLEGRAVFSCLVPVGDVAGKRITTLEGLATEDRLHPLQQAVLDEQAAQCGYCLPGVIMTAAALLEANPSPSDAEIREALAGSLCRCGSQPRILRAIRRVIDAEGAAGDTTF